MGHIELAMVIEQFLCDIFVILAVLVPHPPAKDWLRTFWGRSSISRMVLPLVQYTATDAAL